MANKVIKTRMQQKHDTSENWAKAENFSPLIGEIIVYDDLNKFKIGDGKTNVNDLPFASGGIGDSGTGDSSTIFNSDENKALTAFSAASGYKTIAGKRAFKITAKPSDTSFTLDSVDGLAVDDVVSYSVIAKNTTSWKEVQDLGKITSITDKTITLDTPISTTLTQELIAANQSSTNRIACRLWVNAKPEIGTYDLSTKANARGRENKALGEASDVGGKGNIVTGPYGAAINSGNRVDAETGFAFGAGNTIESGAIRSAVGGEKNLVKAPHSLLGGYQNESESKAAYSVGWGHLLKVQNENEAVFGRYNEPKDSLIFSVGCGIESTGRKNAFEIYSDGTVNMNGDFRRVAYINAPQNAGGWVKFADYTFSRYRQGGALLNIKQTYVGKKYNILVELELNTDDTGFHPDEGIIFRQLAGKDICDKIGYVIDSATNNISFYIKKTRYDHIYINLLSDTFGGYMKYYSNNPIEANEPAFTAKMSNSLLGASKEYVDNKFSNIDLSDYYTKSQVDSKLSSVYKFVGSISTPMLIPSVTHQKGDVYNCRWGGRIPDDYSSSRTITALTYTKVSNTSYTGTITFSEDITYDLMYAEYFGITIEGYSDTQMFLTGRITNAHSGDVSECSELKFQVDPTEFSDYEIQISGLYNNPIIEFLNTVSGITSPISCTACNISRDSYVTHHPQQLVSKGGNIAYTGTNDPYYWDVLGTTIDISAKADKATTLAGYGITDTYTKTEIDNKITSVYKYKGSKQIFSELPSSATCVTGDVWNVESEVSRNFYGVKVVSVYAYGMGFDGEGGEMVLADASAFAIGKTYQVCTDGKKILGTITPTGISGNTLSFTHQTNSDYYGVFCDIAETKDPDYWNTWMEGTAVSINETYYFYSADFASTPPGTDKITKIINEGGTNFAWTGTAWDALGGTVDFSDYYTRTQVDGKIAAAIESALNTEV